MAFTDAAPDVSSCPNCQSTSSSSATRGRTPTQRSHTADVEAEAAYHNHNHSSFSSHYHHDHDYENDRRLPGMVYVVTDTCYPSALDFDRNIGITSVISVHGSKSAANERAKKIIYENDGGCTVDIDKIIEEVKKGLYTGIGVGGKEEKDGCCFARKCEVEAKIVDEDSEDEGSGDSVMYGGGSDQENNSNNNNRSREANGRDGGQEGDIDMS